MKRNINPKKFTWETIEIFLSVVTLGIVNLVGIYAQGSIVVNAQSPQVPDITSDYKGGKYSSLAFGHDGLPVISYYNEGTKDLKVVKCGNIYCTQNSSGYYIDGYYGDVGKYTSIAIGTDGNPIVSYYDETNKDLKVVKCSAPDCRQQSKNIITTVHSDGNVGDYSSIAVPSDGFPIISYYDDTVGTTEGLRIVKCGTVSCNEPSKNTYTLVDAGIDVGSDTSLAIGVDGLPIISYFTNGRAESPGVSDIKVLKCGNASCTEGNVKSQINTSTYYGTGNVMKIGLDGLPILAYLNATNSDIRVTKCGNLACSSANTTTVIDSRAAHFSMAIGSDGLPVISYYKIVRSNTDNNNPILAPEGDLKVLKCGNASCSSGNSSMVVDSLGNVGLYTSLAMAPDGLPSISYYDESNTDLKYVKCGNASCSAGNTIVFVDSPSLVPNF